MAIYKNSKYDILYYDDRSASEDNLCEVRIGEGEMVVDYEDDGERILYKGRDKGNGHFELYSEEVKGRATFHMFEGSRFIEGSWVEDGARGMWKIRLA